MTTTSWCRRLLFVALLTTGCEAGGDGGDRAIEADDTCSGTLCDGSGGTDGVDSEWGHVTPIADDAHPNLYYNQGEIDALREMVLVQHEPAHLYARWVNGISDALAVGPEVGGNPNSANMRAGLSYALEPTQAKADAIRTALLAFMTAFPAGGGSSGDVWYQTDGWWFSGYSVPWLFDLLLAYHPEVLSPAERSALVDWFSLTARIGRTGSFVDEPGSVRTVEGKTVGEYANWWTRYLGNSFASALVSGDQAAVDYWVQSTWPRDQLTYDGSWSVPDDANRFDLVMYLLAVYPSGANVDTYAREGYNNDTREWYTTDYTLGGYHWAQMYGAVLGAEMAYHNGLRRVFEITDAGTEPALVRTYRRAYAALTETDYQPANRTGHPTIGYDAIFFAGFRRYGVPDIEAAIPAVLDVSQSATYDGFDMSVSVLEFLAYPRDVVWRPGDPVALPQ